MSLTRIPEGGFTLPSGKVLTREDAELIGKLAGLDTSRKSDDDETLNVEKVPDNEGGYNVVHRNPVYRPYIYKKLPLPPMLVFISSSPGNASSYTINLNTLKPTGSSKIQKELPASIRSRYL
jgi:hypothetical protein